MNDMTAAPAVAHAHRCCITELSLAVASEADNVVLFRVEGVMREPGAVARAEAATL
jgi:hypothetical protein